MKRKRISGLAGFIMIGVLAAGLAGCAGGKQNGDGTGLSTSGPSESSETGNEIKQQESDEKNADTTVSYPLETEDVLTIWDQNLIPIHSEYASYQDSPFHTGLEKNTGVTVEWQWPAQGADANQAYNLLLTEDKLPDIISKGISAGEAAQLLADGVIYDLTDYLPLYAPDYWAYLTSPENADILREIKTEDGRLYSVTAVREDNYNLTYVGPVMRQDWLDECGLEAPVTLEDWETVLTAFQEKYGAAFGFTVSRMNAGGLYSGAGAYGGFAAGFYVDDSGTIQFIQGQPEWREYMEILHRWYEMGLIDKDSVTMDDAALRTKVLNNKIGASTTAMSQITNWMTDAQAEGTGANWVGVGYPRTAPGVPTCMIQTTATRNLNNCSALITTSCSEEKLITALKWLNYGFTKEGIMYWNYGTEGVTYTMDENGEPQWTDLILNDPLGGGCVSKYIGTHGSGLSVQQAHLVRLKNEKNAVDAVYTWIENTEAQKHCIPRVSMTEQETLKYSDKMAAITTRVEEVSLAFLTGDIPLSQYDALIEELYGMGLQECIDIYQAAYDRFMSK